MQNCEKCQGYNFTEDHGEKVNNSKSDLNDLLCCDSAKRIKSLVAKQANEEGLWFNARYVTEDYLQNALRELHKVIEDEFGTT